jgi:hypothetical protein
MMNDDNDRKMFAPLRNREAISPTNKLFNMLTAHESAVTAAVLAERLVTTGFAVGTKVPVTKRIGELLDEMEEAGRVERVPDGRYRAVNAKR